MITDPYERTQASHYQSGADMWSEYKAQYGVGEALGICNRYLDLQVRATDPGELRFCRELYAAMRMDVPLISPDVAPKESVIGHLHRTQAELSNTPAGKSRDTADHER